MVCGIAAVTMPKPSFSLRAEQSSALDLSADAPSGLASQSRRDFVFVVNPKGANGRTGKEWKKLLPYLRTRLGGHCNKLLSMHTSRLQCQEASSTSIKG